MKLGLLDNRIKCAVIIFLDDSDIFNSCCGYFSPLYLLMLPSEIGD